MARQRLLLLLAVLLAALWTIWLGYEAYTAGDPVVVSRPQLLVAPIIVEGELVTFGSGGRGVHVTHVYRGQELLPREPGGEVQDQPLLKVNGIPDEMEGACILALSEPQAEGGLFAVVPTPSSLRFRGGKTPIYPATESTRTQVRQVIAALGR